MQNPIGLLLAALLTQPTLRGRGFFRTAYFLPTMLSFVIVGFIWQLILSPIWGISKGFLDLLGLGFLFQPWLGKPETALVTLGLISVWQFVGIPMMLFYAALIGIPDELIEAARVDGASYFTAFWRIKFPLILPTIGIVTILTFVGNFNAFDLIYTTQGRAGRPQLRDRHPGHLLLSHLLWLPAAARQPHHGRDHRHDDVPHHPDRRAALPVPVAATGAAL